MVRFDMDMAKAKTKKFTIVSIIWNPSSLSNVMVWCRWKEGKIADNLASQRRKGIVSVCCSVKLKCTMKPVLGKPRRIPAACSVQSPAQAT